MPYGSYQYGQYGYKCEPLADDVELDGERVFRWRPDWRNGVQLSFFASTVISETSRLVEQRRAQYTALKRKQSFYVADDEYLPEVENFLRRWHSAVIWMPVWSERLVVTTTDLQGETVIDVVDTEDRFCLNTLGGQVALLDRSLAVTPEVFDIDAVGATSVTLATAVSGAFTSANALLYPAYPAFLDTNQFTDITAHVCDAALTWREWF